MDRERRRSVSPQGVADQGEANLFTPGPGISAHRVLSSASGSTSCAAPRGAKMRNETGAQKIDSDGKVFC